MLLYKGKVGETTLRSLPNTLKFVMPVSNTYKIIYRGTKLASTFNIKDEITNVHAKKIGHENVNIDHFEILSNGYKSNKFKRKLAEALHIKHERPTMNVQEQSVPLKLFN